MGRDDELRPHRHQLSHRREQEEGRLAGTVLTYEEGYRGREAERLEPADGRERIGIPGADAARVRRRLTSVTNSGPPVVRAGGADQHRAADY